MPDTQDRTVKSADNLFGVLHAVHELDGAGTTDVASRLDIAKSTAHDHLTTLVEHEFLIKDGSTYRVGLKCLYYGIQAKNRIELAQVAKPSLEQLADETGEIVWLLVEEYGKGVFIEKAKGERAVQPYGEVGKRVPLYDIASGKAILAHLPEKRVREICDQQQLSKHTENTLADIDDLLADLEATRERGYSLNDGETFEGFRAVGAPLVHDGELLGSIAVSGPENRFRGDRFRQELPEVVTGAANAIELSMASR
ncbi:IclR family transcriptional regulator [Salinadaptatus halalkaliphilus]|uniref:IclR family transcriptional regulator n=1 Tax=Salinadaptatus halalkaliphilus TaxID=2419781 RepID=A0A4S3TM85_9EURY|nr:IclR family transcriptional regulator [Salinadaptatus halalkaliphilus]THE64115.1 IclR family transcriptional regulator [Salinadaptatus halalkaliphilus]